MDATKTDVTEPLLPGLHVSRSSSRLTNAPNSSGNLASVGGKRPLAEEQGFSHDHLNQDQQVALAAKLARLDTRWKKIVLVSLACGTLITLLAAFVMSVIPTSTEFTADCMMPLGGGHAQPGGSFQHFNSTRCAAQMERYLEEGGAYYQGVERVAVAAMVYVKELLKTTQLTQPVFVFDIDETALSNAEEWTGSRMDPDNQLNSQGAEELAKPCTMQGMMGRTARKLRMALPSPGVVTMSSAATTQLDSADPEDDTLLSRSHRHEKVHKRRHKRGSSEEPSTHSTLEALPSVLRGWSVDNRPPLLAVQHLYLFLIHHNISVAFVTGRKESAREDTEENLKAAGYGELCAVSPDTPCYAALLLRGEDDNRPASVTKPDMRKALVDMGYTLIGNIGDQFSDGSGTSWADSFWKLPNIFYYIL